MADYIHTFNINITESIDKTLERPDLSDEQRKTLTEAKALLTKSPQEVVSPESRSKVKSIIKELSSFAPELAKEMEQEFSNAIRKVAAEFSKQVSDKLIKGVSLTGLKPESSATALSRINATNIDLFKTVTEDFTKFKKGLLDALSSTLELELGKKFRVLGTNVEDAFKKGPSGQEYFRLVNVKELDNLLRTHKVNVSPNATLDAKVEALTKYLMIQDRAINTPERPINRLTESEAQAIAKHIATYGYKGSIKEVKQASASPDKLQNELLKIINDSNKVATILKETIASRQARDIVGSAVHTIPIPTPTIAPGGVPSIKTSTGYMKAIGTSYEFTPGMLEAVKLIGKSFKDYDKALQSIKKALLANDPTEIEKNAKVLWAYRGKNEKISGGIIDAAAKVIPGRATTDLDLKAEAVKTGRSINELRQKALKEIEADLQKFQIPYSELFRAMSKLTPTNVFDSMLRTVKEQRAGVTSAAVRLAQNLEERPTEAVSNFVRDIRKPLQDLDIFNPERPMAAVQAVRTSKVTMPDLTGRSEGRAVMPAIEIQAVKALNAELERSKRYLGTSLSTLGISEGKAASFKYDEGRRTASYNMYQGDINTVVPFGRLRNEGRVIYPVSQARLFNYIDTSGKVKADLPTVRAPFEHAAIQEGVFPSSGYGMNLMTKLVDSARVFEDQIVVSEKVMRGFSTVVKRVIAELQPQVAAGKLSLRDVAKNIIETAPELGEEKLNTNADVATITKIEDIINRFGATDKAALQITDTIFSTLSTKITSRFGSKGTLTYVPQETLGYTERPLSVVEMMSKLLSSKGSSRFASRMEQSGIMPFLKGIEVPEDNRKEYQYIRSRTKKLFREKFGVELSSDAAEMARQLQGLIEKEFGKQALKVKVPIDAQISIKGLTKRLNLGAEVAEMMTSTIGGGTNVIPTSGKSQVAIFEQLNAIGKALGYKSTTGTKEPVNFYSDITTSTGIERAIAGQKFFVMTGDKNEQASWSTKDILTGRRGISLNPAGVSAFLSRYSPNTALGRLTIDQFIPRRDKVELAMELFKMRKVPPEETLQPADLSNFKPLPEDTGLNLENIKNTVLDNPNLYGRLVKVPKMDVDAVTGLPVSTGQVSTYIPKKRVFETYFNATLGQEEPTRITRLYDRLLSSKFNLDKLQNLPDSELGQSIDVDFLRSNLRQVVGKRLLTTRSNIKDIFKDMSLVKAGEKHPEDATKAAATVLDNELQFLNKLKVMFDKLKSPQAWEDYAKVPGLADLIKKQYSELTSAIKLIEKNVERARSGKSVSTKDLNSLLSYKLPTIKDLFVRTAPSEDLMAQYEDIIKARAGKLDITKLSTATQEYLRNSVLSDKSRALDYGWGKVLGLKRGEEAKAVELKKNIFDLMVAGRPEDVPEKARRMMQRSIEMVLKSNKFRIQRSPGLLNMASEDALIQAAGAYGVPVQSTKAFAIYKEQAKLASAQRQINEYPETRLIGKNKSIQDIQERVLPGVTGGSYNALVSKIKDFAEAYKTLAPMLGDKTVSVMKSLMMSHKKFIDSAKEAGEIVLQELEVGVTKKNYDLLVPKRTRRELYKQGMLPYAETARFPLTGEYSFQPSVLKQVNMSSPFLAGREAKSIAIPGIAGGIDFKQLARVRSEAQAKLQELRAQRRNLPATAEGDQQRIELTKKINDVIKALTLLEVKFRAGAQNLDYDGDPVYAHTALMKQTNRHLNAVNAELEKIKQNFKGTDAEFAALAKQKREAARRLDEQERLAANKEIGAARERFRSGLSGGLVSPIAQMHLAKVSEEFPANTSVSNLEALYKKRRAMSTLGDSVRIMGQTYSLDELRPEVKRKYLEELYKQEGKVFEPETILKLGGVANPSQNKINELINKEFRLRVREGSIQKYLTKPHLGLSTETINQMARVTEAMYGLGTVKSPYDVSPALGKPIIGQDQTGAYGIHRMHQMSGLLQYFINAGMSVKHGGAAPKYEEIPKLLLKGGLYEEILDPKGMFSGFAKEAKAFEDAVRANLEGLSSKQFDQEVKRFFGTSLDDLKKLGKTREDVTEELVAKLGFKGLFDEMRNAIIEHYGVKTGKEGPAAEKALMKYVDSKSFNWFKLLEEIFPAYKVRTQGFERRVNTEDSAKFLEMLRLGGDVSGMLMRSAVGKNLSYPTLSFREYNPFIAAIQDVAKPTPPPQVAEVAAPAGSGGGGKPPKKPPVAPPPSPEEPEDMFSLERKFMQAKYGKYTHKDIYNMSPEERSKLPSDIQSKFWANEKARLEALSKFDDVPMYGRIPFEKKTPTEQRDISARLKSAVLAAFPDMASSQLKREVADVLMSAKTNEKTSAMFSKIEGGGKSGTELRQLIGQVSAAMLEQKAKQAGKSLKDYIKALERAQKEGASASEQVIKDAEEARKFLTTNMAALELAHKSGASALSTKAYRLLKERTSLGKPKDTMSFLDKLENIKPAAGEEDKVVKDIVRSREVFPKSTDAFKYLIGVAKKKGLASLSEEYVQKEIPEPILNEIKDLLNAVRKKPIGTAEIATKLRELMGQLPKAYDKGVFNKISRAIWSEYHAAKLQGLTEMIEATTSETGKSRLTEKARNAIAYTHQGKIKPFQSPDEMTRLANIRVSSLPKEDVMSMIPMQDTLVAKALDEVLTSYTSKPYEGLQKAMQIMTSDRNASAMTGRLEEFRSALERYIGLTYATIPPEEFDTLKQIRTQVVAAQRKTARVPEAMRLSVLTGSETPGEFRFKKDAQIEALKEAMLKAAQAGELTPGYERPYQREVKGELGEIFKIRRRLRAVQTPEGQWKIEDLPAKGSMLATDFGRSIQSLIETQQPKLRNMLETIFSGRGTGMSAVSRIRNIYAAARTGEGGRLDMIKASKELGSLVEVLKKIRSEAKGIDEGVYQEVSFFINELNKLVRGIHKAGGELAQIGPAMSAKGVSYETPETARKLAAAALLEQRAAMKQAIQRGELRKGATSVFSTYLVDEQGRPYEQRYRATVKESRAGELYPAIQKISEMSFDKLAAQAMRAFKTEPQQKAMLSLLGTVQGANDINRAMQSVLASIRTFNKAKGIYEYKPGSATTVLEYRAQLQEMLRTGKDKQGNILMEHEIEAIKMLVNELRSLAKVISTTSSEELKVKSFSKYGGVSAEEFNAIQRTKIEKARQAVEAQIQADLLAGRTVRRGQREFITYKERLGDQEFTRKAVIGVKRASLLGGYKVVAEQAPPPQMPMGTRFGTAMSRVMMWGAASGLIYGALAQTKALMSTMVEVEAKMAELKKVMPAITTNFNDMRDAAVKFAKDYGAELTQVLDTMRIFAQQGLSAPEVKEMTRVSTLASNVTTMEPSQAAEALTAATRQFNMAAEDSIKILDAWNEVENNFAITSENLADAIKKSGTAARVAGIDFNRLNGYVTAIGEATRQTGKEIGTSLRFIFSRLNTEKAPKALASVGVSTTSGGNVRPGSEVLDDLARKWDTLNEAQKLSIAQAMGGIRQYNAVMVLMENYGRALEASAKSLESIGSAERENQIVMETTRKKLAQLKAAYDELAVKASGALLPVMKGGIGIATGAVNTLNAIPGGGLAAGIGAGYMGALTLEKLFNISMFATQLSPTGERVRKPWFFKSGFKPREMWGSIKEAEGVGGKWKAFRELSTTGRAAAKGAIVGEEVLAGAGTAAGLTTMLEFAAILAAVIAAFKALEIGAKQAAGVTNQYTQVVKSASEAASAYHRASSQLPVIQYDLAKAQTLKQLYSSSPTVVNERVGMYDYKSPLLLQKKSFESIRDLMTDVMVLTGAGVDEMDGFGRAVIKANSGVEKLAESLSDVVKRVSEARQEAFTLAKSFEVSVGMRGYTSRGSANKGFLGNIVGAMANMAAQSGSSWLRELGAKAQTPFERVMTTRANLRRFRAETGGSFTMPTTSLFETNPNAYREQLNRYEEYQTLMQEYKAATEQYRSGIMAQKRQLFASVPTTGVSSGAALGLVKSLGVGEIAKAEYGMNKAMYQAVVPQEKVTTADILASYYLKARGVNAGPSQSITLELARQAGLTTQGTYNEFLARAAASTEMFKTGQMVPEAYTKRQVLMFNQQQLYGTGENQFRIGAGQVLYTPTSTGGMVEYTKILQSKDNEVRKVETVIQTLDEFNKTIMSGSDSVKGFVGVLEAVKLERAKTAALYTSVVGSEAGLVTPPREKALQLGKRFSFQVDTATLMYNLKGGTGEFVKQYAEQQQRYRFIQAQIQQAEKGGKTVSPETIRELDKLAAELDGMANITIRVIAAITDMNKALESSELAFRRNLEVYKETSKYNVALAGPLAGKQKAPQQAMSLVQQAYTMNPTDLMYASAGKGIQSQFGRLETTSMERQSLINQAQIIARTKAEIEYLKGPEATKLQERLGGRIDLQKAKEIASATGAGIGTSMVVDELTKQTSLLQTIADNTALISIDPSDLGKIGSAFAYAKQSGTSSRELDQYLEFVKSEGASLINRGVSQDKLDEFIKQASRIAEDKYKAANATPNELRSAIINSAAKNLMDKIQGIELPGSYSAEAKDRIYRLKSSTRNNEMAKWGSLDLKDIKSLQTRLAEINNIVASERRRISIMTGAQLPGEKLSASDERVKAEVALAKRQHELDQKIQKLTHEIIKQISTISSSTRTLQMYSNAVASAVKAFQDLQSTLYNAKLQSGINNALIEARSTYRSTTGSMLEYQAPSINLDRRLFMSQYSPQEYLYSTNNTYRSNATEYLKAQNEVQTARQQYEAIVSARARFETIGTAAGLSKEDMQRYLKGVSITGSAELGPLFTSSEKTAENTSLMVSILKQIAEKSGISVETPKSGNVFSLEGNALENVRVKEAIAQTRAKQLLQQELPEIFRRKAITGGGLSAGGYIQQTLISGGSKEDAFNRAMARAADVINKSLISPIMKFADTMEETNRTLAINNRLTKTRAEYLNVRGGPMRYQPLQANVDLRTSPTQYSAHEVLYNQSASYRQTVLQYNLAMNKVNAARRREEAMASLQGNMDFLAQQYGVKGASRIAAGVLTTGSMDTGAMLGALEGVESNTAQMVKLLEKIAGVSETKGSFMAPSQSEFSLEDLKARLASERRAAEQEASGIANVIRQQNIAKQTAIDIAAGRYMSKEQYIREQRVGELTGTMTPEIAARNKALLTAGELDKQQRQTFELNKSKALEGVGREIGGIDSLINAIQSGISGVVVGRNTRPLDERFSTWSQANRYNKELVADRQSQFELAKNLYSQIMSYKAQGIDVGISSRRMYGIMETAAGGGDILNSLTQVAKELRQAKQVREAKQRQIQALEYADAMARVGNAPVVSAINEVNRTLQEIKMKPVKELGASEFINKQPSLKSVSMETFTKPIVPTQTISSYVNTISDTLKPKTEKDTGKPLTFIGVGKSIKEVEPGTTLSGKFDVDKTLKADTIEKLSLTELSSKATDRKAGETSISDVADDLSDLQDELEAATVAFTDLTSKLNEVIDKFDSVAESSSKVSDTFDGIDEIGTKFASLSDGVSKASEKLNVFSEELSPNMKAPEKDTVGITKEIFDTVIGEINDKLNTLTDTIASLGSTSVDDQLADVYTSLAELSEEISNDTLNIDQIQSTLTQMSTRMEEITVSVTDLYRQLSLNSSEVDTVSTNFDLFKADVELSMKSLQNMIDDLRVNILSLSTQAIL